MTELRVGFEVVEGTVLERGGARLEWITIEPGLARCGRRRSCDVILVDPRVSRHQFDVECTGEGVCTLVVPEPAAPVLVAGVRVVGRHALRDGDEVRVGGILLLHRGAGGSDESHATITTVRRQDQESVSHLVVAGGAPTGSRRSIRYLQVLGELGDSLLHLDDPVSLRQRMLAVVLEHLPVTRALIAVCPEGQDRLVPETWMVAAEDQEGETFELSAGLLEHIMKESTVCAFEEASALQAGQSVRDASIRSAMGAALREGERVRGVLYADNRRRGVTFSDGDRAFFAALAGFVATTLTASRRVAALVSAVPLEDVEDGERRMIGVSPVMCALAQRAQRLARLRAPVLILGERGTGKGVVARYVHRHSPRRTGSFVHVNCASIPAPLAEAELFGIAPDSGVANAPRGGRPGFFQSAAQGTIFLDEVGDLPESVQPKLLVALREGLVTPVGSPTALPVDVRVVAATNRDVDGMAREDHFRHDLIDRLGALRIEVPPLRERVEDIPHLARYLLACLLREEAWERDLALSDEAVAALARRRWPGNVAELENVLREAMAFAEGEVITVEELPPAADDEGLPTHPLRTLAEAEALHIAQVLDRLGWNKARTARVLQIARNTLDDKIKRYGLTPPPGIKLRQRRST
jgi:DNA-binding NtrC family response regulator